jgi:hypothetical protein
VDRLFGTDDQTGFAKTVADTYYKPAGSGQQLSDVVVANQKRYKQLLAEAVQSGKLTAPEAAAREKNFQAGKLGPHGSPTTINTLSSLENEQFCLLRHPQGCADGLYRTQDYYVAPGTLQLGAVAQGWETSEDIPVADTVVVGAGPGGLSTAWQLARLGGRVVCFESELAGSAFSDAGAKAVHTMRTSADGSNLVQDGHALATLDHPLSLHGHLPAYRHLALSGQRAEESLTGVPTHGVTNDSKDPQDRNSPANRGELFEHLAQLSHSLATDFQDAFLCERSPVDGVEFQDGLFTVTTSRGHKVKARNVVLATGLTGTEGQKARLLPQFDQLGGAVTLLGKESDVSERAAELGSPKALVVHDRLLGQQAVRQSIQSLPGGSRAAVVGSGESAVKAVTEMLHLNPGLSVDLFCKDKMEAAQTQIPNENFHTAVLENTLQDPQAADNAWERVELFGTPVTPRTLQELLELQTAGRVRLLEMGSYFDQNSVNVSTGSDGSVNVEIIDSKVKDQLSHSHTDFQAKGLTSPDSHPFEKGSYQAVVQAVGYRQQPLSEHPLRHLPPEAHERIHLNSAGAPLHPAETSLAGLSVRGRQLAEMLAEGIPPERRVANTVPQDRGIDWRTVDEETVQGMIDSRGLHPGFVASVGGDPLHPQYLQIKLPNSDYKLRELYRKRESGKITAAELEVLERALTLADRMDGSAGVS